MAFGSLSSLGFGSGVLTQDTLDQLKKADEGAQITPYDKKIENNSLKQKDLAEIKTKLLTFKTAVSALGDATAFAKRKVVSSGGDNPAASLVANSGVNLQNMSIKVNQLAEKDVYQSGGITSETDRILPNLTNGQKAYFTLIQNDKEYKITIDSSTTYKDLADQITKVSDGNIQAKIVNTGEKDAPYRLVMSSKETGEDNAIRFFDGYRDQASGQMVVDQHASQALQSLGWGLDKNSISPDGLNGFVPSVGKTQTSNITSLSKDISFTIVVNGDKHQVDLKVGDDFAKIANKIDKATNGEVILKSDSSGNAMFDLKNPTTKFGVFDGVYNSKTGMYETNADATDFFQNTLGMNLNKDKTIQGYGVKDQDSHIQTAKNAEFTMDGIKMVRQSNTITDIGVGLTLTLNKVGEINFDIQQDTESLSKAMEDLVNAYNDLMANLEVATNYDSETGASGTLQGVSAVTSIRSTIISTLFGSQAVEGEVEDANGNKIKATVMVSLQDYGLTLNESGTLSFDKSKFDEKVAEDPSFAEQFFAGVSGWEELNFVGEEASIPSSVFQNGSGSIDFKDKNFKIKFNEETYDLSKTADGKDFILTGKDEKEMMQNLVDHINSFGIDGLNVSLQEIDKSGTKKYSIKFNSDNGSDFSIKGDDKFLEQFGLKETNITIKAKEGTGIFANLKKELKNMTDSNGSLSQYDEQLTRDNKSLKSSKESTQALINMKYDTMANQWLQYEGILSKLNRQLSNVTSMINAMNNQQQ